MPFPPNVCGSCLGPKTGTHPRFCDDCVAKHDDEEYAGPVDDLVEVDLDLASAIITAYSRFAVLRAESDNREPQVVLGLQLGGRENASRAVVEHLYLLDPEACALMMMGVIRAAQENAFFEGQLRAYLLKMGVTVA